jgi:hypothetical protein
MSDAKPSLADTLAVAEEVDSLCDRFEDAWRQGRRPSIREWLHRAGGAARAALVELVRLDLEYRRKAGETATVEEYLTQYPELRNDPAALARLRGSAATMSSLNAGQATMDGSPHPSEKHAGKKRESTDFLAPPQAPGELGRLGGYRVLEVLGRGGMGVVFRAEDPKLQRQVALKAMLPVLAASETSRERFLREARIAASVEHDNVVTIHQVGEDRGIPFLAMPLLHGESLDARMKRESRLPIGEVLRIGREAALGLAAAHHRGLVHRDVKPANLWLEEDTGRVKVLDFGLARAVNATEHLTTQGAIVGTPAYMAPEQADGESVDARTDLFSLGCVLYRMATGELAFQGKDAISTLMAVVRHNPAAPSSLNVDVSPGLSDFIMQMLCKDPAGRPASAREVAEWLAVLRGEWAAPGGTAVMTPAIPKWEETLSAPTPAPLPIAAAPRPRRRRVWIVAAGVLALLIGGGVLTAIIIHIKGPDGKDVEIKVPDGSTVVVEKDGKPVSTVGPDGATGPAAAPLPVDDAWVKQVAGLPAQKQLEAVVAKLKELNPDFDGQVTPTLKDGVVVKLEFLTVKVKDISPVRGLPGLQTVDCHGWAYDPAVIGQLDDLSPLKDTQLTFVAFDFNKVWNLEPLKNMKLTGLVCYATPVSDLTPIRGMKLTSLNCGNTQVSDLSPVKGMPLTNLSCQRSLVSDLSPLKGIFLTHLDCGGNRRLSDLTPLEGMPLAELYCQDTEVTDLSPLKSMPLKELWCDFKPERDAVILRSIKTLEKINGKPAKEVLKEADKK